MKSPALSRRISLNFRQACWSAASAVFLTLGQASAEPQPPDVFDLISMGAGKTADWVNVEAVLKPNIDSDVELEIAAESGVKLATGGRKKPFKLQRGGADIREKLEVDVSDGKAHTLKVRLRLLNADGKPWMVINRELRVAKPGSAAAASVSADDERVPVVHVLADGTKVVERMSRKEARERGLPENGRPAPSFRRIPMNGQPAAK